MLRYAKFSSDLLTLILVLSTTAIGLLLFIFLQDRDAVWVVKFLFLGGIGTAILAALATNFEKYKRYIPLILVALISQTGFTYTIQPGLETSGNEVFTVTLLIIWVARRIILRQIIFPRTNFFSALLSYIFIAVCGVFTAILYFKILPLNILTEFKAYVLYLFYLFLIPECISTEDEVDHVLWALIFFSLIPLFSASTEALTITDVRQRLSTSDWGALNIFVGFILPVFFVGLGQMLSKGKVWLKLYLAAMLMAIVYFLIIAQTRGGWVGLILGLGIFFLLGRRKIVMVTLLLIITVIVISSPLANRISNIVAYRIVEQTITADNSLEERFRRFHVAWGTAMTYPLTGSGWGGFLPLQADGSVTDQSLSYLPRWHNSYMEVLSQLGFPGLLAFLWLWLKILHKELDTLQRLSNWKEHSAFLGLFVAVLSCLVYALSEQQFFRIETASFTYFLAGLLIAKGKLMRANVVL